MFDIYDDYNKLYELTFSDGNIESLTTQELWEFFLMQEHSITGTFKQLKARLDKGEEITAQDTRYDWTLQTSIYVGNVLIKRIKPLVQKTTQPTTTATPTTCLHQGKYVNQAGGVKFWVCPLCKKDLGNA
jgi:hypothetical protein